MSFVSPVFFLYLPAVLVLYWLIPGRYRWMVLLPASLLFYAWHNVWLLGLILLTILVSYRCGLAIEDAATPRGRKLALAADAVVCLGVLFLFKYLDFTLAGVFGLARLLGFEVSFSGVHLLLPMGISFYTFQTLSYAIDVCRGMVPAERHLGYYALFVTFFPQLVAGPIERPGALLPQLKEPRKFSDADVPEGLRCLLRGYVKKVLLADYLAPFVDAAYDNAAAAGGSALAVATALFALQIYCDFSGYTDIALGCGHLMGIRLTENFRRPYAAASLRDFWRRWHISLTGWFTDYLYIPLGGSRRGLGRQCLNTLVVFAVSGLWHGANVTFLVWGLFHGVCLVGERLLLRGREVRSRAGRLVHRGATLLVVWFAWIFFRSPTMADALLIIRSIFTDFSPGAILSGLGMGGAELLGACLLVALLPLAEGLPALARAGAAPARLGRQSRTVLLYFLLTASVLACRCLVLTGGGAAAFIYFQF